MEPVNTSRAWERNEFFDWLKHSSLAKGLTTHNAYPLNKTVEESKLGAKNLKKNKVVVLKIPLGAIFI